MFGWVSPAAMRASRWKRAWNSGSVARCSRRILSATIRYAIAQLRRGRRPSIGEPIRRALSRLPAMLGLGLVLFVAILLLLITIVGWIWASVLWSMAYPVLVLEGGGVMHALSRSRQLVRGSWWRVFGILLLIWLIYAFISFVIVLVGAAVAGLLAFAGESTPVALGQAIVQLVFSVAQQALTQPFSVAGTVLLYYDLRVRKEGLDLQERAEGLLAAGAPASP